LVALCCHKEPILNLTIVVLAAGQGVRIKSDLPKVMHPLAGRPMVRHVVETARSLEPNHLSVVVGYGADLVRQALGDEVAYATQAEQLGTGHAVLQAEQSAAGKAGSVLVLYGDTPLILSDTLRQMVAHHEAANAAVTILSFRPPDPSGYGRIVRDAGGQQVLAIVEDEETTPEQKAIGEVNSGILCFRDRWVWPNLARLERRPGAEFYLTDLVAMAVEQGETVAALPAAPIEVIGLDNRGKLAQAEAELRRRINEKWMLAGVTLVQPEMTFVDADVEIGTDTVIWPNTYLQGTTTIGRGCTLGPGTVIRDSSIGHGCRVELSVVEQATMEDDCDMGPFGHLRKGAHLGKGVHMGNYGEVKNSYLGPGVKMGHFSYIGDAEIGAGTNIGAGTVTCNYDGKRKHRTTIGQEAFIGSGSMLVAPLEIGDHAVTGAGSVVTHDVPPGQKAYGVPARVKAAAEAEEAEAD
jgi:bifunctional UDP-N-acetylglucosamine pyrophosphorylase/glucosamine-1-phosphate N-acetyltransferase